MYCRIKLQKILLRQELREAEILIGMRILEAIKSYAIDLEVIRATKLGIVLKRALKRRELSQKGGRFAGVSSIINSVFDTWRSRVDRLLKEIGLM